VRGDVLVELARDAGDGLLSPRVGRAQPAGREPAEVRARLDHDDAFAQPRRLNPRREAWGVRAIHQHVAFFD
jgi:hypothetical protein